MSDDPLDVQWVTNESGLLVPMREGQEVTWSPQPGSQQLFLKLTVPEVLYEGNRGPGKTDALLMDFFQDVNMGWGADWVGVLFRKTYPELQDVIEKSRKWFKRVCPAATFDESKSFWKFPHGEKLYFRQFAKPSDYWKYHGHAYPWIAWEELCTYASDECYKTMFSCSRSTRMGMPRKIRGTANPYGPGHNWVKLRFGLPVPGKGLLGNLIRTPGEPDRVAVHGHLMENKILLRADPDYVDRIRAAARNPAELAAWIDGSWDIVAGGMIDDVWFEAKDQAVLEPFEIPADWRIDRAMDWGSSKPSSIGYWAQSDGSDYRDRHGKRRSTVRGDLFHVGEVYTWTGKPNEGTRWTNSEIAKRCVEYEISRGWRGREDEFRRVRVGPGDSQMFSENGTETTIADDLARPVQIDGRKYRGIRFEPCEKGPGSRKQGWQQLRQWIRNVKPEKGVLAREKPGLFVVGTWCPQWMRTVPTLPRDDKDMDDVDTEAEDHAGDMTRYRLRQAVGRTGQRTSTGHGG